MTMPDQTDSPQPIAATATADALVQNAGRLGLTWDLKPGTVKSVSPLAIAFDDDTVAVGATSMIGAIKSGARVYVMVVPPAGNFIVGTPNKGPLPGTLVCHIVLTTVTQTLTNSTVAAIQFPDADVYDPFDMHNPSSNNSRVTLPFLGWYMFSGGIGYTGNANGVRDAIWSKTGTQVPGGQVQLAATPGGVPASIPARSIPVQCVNPGVDYMELLYFQNSGSNLNPNKTNNDNPYITAVYLGA
jgi:hypothetical protein